MGPRGAIRRVRAAAPGGTRRRSPGDGPGFWSVTRYADIRVRVVLILTGNRPLRPWRRRWRPPGGGLGELEFAGGTRGEFPGPDSVAGLDQALASVPAQLARGFSTICVKPSQFLDQTAGIGAFGWRLAEKAAALGEARPGRPDTGR